MAGPFVITPVTVVAGTLTRNIVRIRGDSDVSKFRGLYNLSDTLHTRFQPSGQGVPPSTYDPCFPAGFRRMGAFRGPDRALSTPNHALDGKRWTGYTGASPDPLYPTFSQLWSQVDDYVRGMDANTALPWPIHPTIAEANGIVDDCFFGRGDGDWAIVVQTYSGVTDAIAAPVFATNPTLTNDNWVPLMRTYRTPNQFGDPLRMRGPVGNRSLMFIQGREECYWLHGDDTSVAWIRYEGGNAEYGAFSLFCAGFGLPPAVEIAYTDRAVHYNNVTPTRTLKVYLVQEVLTFAGGAWGYVMQTSGELASYNVPAIYTIKNSPTTKITAWAGMKSCPSPGTLAPLANGYFYLVKCIDQDGAVMPFETAGTGIGESSYSHTYIWHKKPPPALANYNPVMGEGEAQGYSVALKIPLDPH